jgi:unsaturated rhamnogalacturonyl hydrolase
VHKSLKTRIVAMVALAIMVLNAAAENQPKRVQKLAGGKIGKRVAEHSVTTPHTNFGRPEPTKFITYLSPSRD